MRYYICIGNRHGLKLYGENGRRAFDLESAKALGVNMAKYFLPQAEIKGEPKTVLIKGGNRQVYDFGHPCFRIIITLPKEHK